MKIGDLFTSAFRSEAEELEALARALATATDFSLLVCRIATRSHRQRLEEKLIARVDALSPGRRLLRVEAREPFENLIDVLAEAAAKQKPDAILLSGLEVCFADPFSTRGRRIIQKMNADRARLRSEVRCPLLFWLPGSVFSVMSQHAHNLVQESSRVYLFDEPSAEVDRLLAQFKAAPANHEQIMALSQQLLALTGRPAVPEDVPDVTLQALFLAMVRQPRQDRKVLGGQDREWTTTTSPAGCREYLALAAAAARSQNFHLAAAAYEKAGRLAAEADDPRQQILANLGQAEIEEILGNFPQAMDSARFALMQAKGFGEKALAEQAATLLQSVCQKRCVQLLPAATPGKSATPRTAKKEKAKQPTVESLRELLSTYLGTESTFDMFCLENFLVFAAAHSMAIERSVRIELLLQAAEPKQILWAVAKTADGRLVIDRLGLRKFI